MKKYLIKVPEKYTKDGAEKTFWHTIGTVAMFDTDGTIKIPALGLNAKLYPVEEKQAAPAPAPAPVPAPAQENTLPAEDIPF